MACRENIFTNDNQAQQMLHIQNVYADLLQSIRERANGDPEHLELINNAIRMAEESIIEACNKNNNSNMYSIPRDNFYRSMINKMGMNMNDVVRQMELSDSNDYCISVLNSPEFQSVKHQYIKCNYFENANGSCLGCSFWYSNRQVLLDILEDIPEFNLIEHYPALYIYNISIATSNSSNTNTNTTTNTIANTFINQMNRLYETFKNYSGFTIANNQAKIKAKEYLVNKLGLSWNKCNVIDYRYQIIEWIKKH